MKKLILTLFAALVLSAGTAMAQSANGYIGKARGAAHDCLNDYNGPGWNVWASESIVSACFVDGFITQVLFAAVPVVSEKSLFAAAPPAYWFACCCGYLVPIHATGAVESGCASLPVPPPANPR